MDYKVKSVLVCRKKDPLADVEGDMPYMVEIKLFNVNDPHKTIEVPFLHLEYNNVMSVVFKGLEVKYLPRGSDLVLNDLEKVSISKVRSKVHNNYKIVIE
ncbi:hypothetical protein J4418_02485 [Candidatus Woesearchaeota archaeon]|nr:hypothetical protein [Candidatus Woesearchaeota archaeon]